MSSVDCRCDDVALSVSFFVFKAVSDVDYRIFNAYIYIYVYRIFNAYIRNHCYACLYTLGLGTPTASQLNIFDSGQIFLVILTGLELGSRMS